MEGKRLKYGFLANHDVLVGRVEPLGLLPSLVAEGVVTFEDKERIKNEVTSTAKVDKLLSIVHRRGVTDEEVYERFLRVLKEAGDSGGQDLDDVVQKIKEDAHKEGIEKRFEYVAGILEERHNAVLKANEHAIVTNLNVEDVLPHLVSSGVVTHEENVAVRNEVTQNKRAESLVKIVHRRGSAAFEAFVSALKKSESYHELSSLLSDGGVVSVEDDQRWVDEVLKRGHVPPRYAILVERKAMTEKIRSELRKLKDTDGWVVVHGMAGFGKTVLVAEAVRDAKLLREVFPGGVNWLTVGQMVDRQGEVDTAKLLTKIQNLIERLDERLDENRYRPTNLEAATDYLQKVISEQHPRSLLILDDVWSYEVAQAFAVRCRTMVTSRHAAVASSVQTPHIYSVSVSEGFSEEEGRELLGLWLHTKPEKLSSHADVILKYCRGSPMAVALIGAILRKNNRDAKWKAIADKLEKNHSTSIHLHAAVNDWNYQHQTLKSSIELSEESLPDHLKEYFQMFVVFDYDTLIPADALETIWGTDTLDTDEFMMELVGYSLAQEAGIGNPDISHFYVHDMVLDYLRETVPRSRQVELHQLVVKRYNEKCNGAFAYLPDDGYVYQKLLSHVAASENWELVGDLLSHLNWLIANVQHGDANIALANYRRFKNNVSEQFTSAVQQFELFVSGHMYILANRPKREDVLQLALLLPDSSDVFQQATAMVSGDRKKSWFKWSNKESDPEKYALKLKLHQGGVRRCQYSGDGSKVVSCSSGGDVKLWDSSTGMVLADFKGHKDMVTCCTMSASGKIIVSSSEDLTVKVWDVRKRRLLTEFKRHVYGVQCCAISPDEKLILSADIDSCINLWETHTGKVVSSWRLSAVSPVISPAVEVLDYTLANIPARSSSQESQSGGEGVLCCAFTVDGTGVITASQNGAVRLWELAGHLRSCFTGHVSHVRCCVFSNDGKLLATASLDNTAKLWDVDSSTCQSTLTHPCAVLSCDFSPDATQIITGDTEGSVKLWSVQLGVLLEDLPLHSDFVNCVLFSPSAPHILSAADNGLIKILWREELEEEHMALVQYHRRFSAHFSRKGVEYEPTILCYNTKEKKLEIVKGSKATPVLQELPTHDVHTPRCWAISNTGSMVVVGYQEGMLQLLQLDKPGEEVPWSAAEIWRRECAHKEEILKCYFAPDDSKIAACTATQHKMWSVSDGKELAVVSGRGIGVRMCVFFADNVRVASAQEKAALIWNSNTGVPQLQCEGINQTDSILCLNLSEDNSRLIASTTSGLVMVWNSSNGEPVLRSLVAPLSPCARSCALSSDGSLAAAGFDDGSLKIWNVAKSIEVAYCPTGSDYWMIDVAFSPDGRKVVTLCDSIEWWRTDGTHEKTVLLKGTFGKYIRFSPDFNTFVTIDNAGLLYILTTL